MEHFTNVNNDKQALCVLTACPIDQVSTRQGRLHNIIRMKNEASKSRLYVEMGPSGGVVVARVGGTDFTIFIPFTPLLPKAYL